MQTASHLLVFILDEQQYALRLSAVERVLRAVAVTPMPKASGIVLGIVNVYGRALPAIDLHERRIHEVVRTNPDVMFKNFISEAVRFAEAPERQLPVSLSPRIEDRDARNEFIRLAEEFIQRVDGKELSGDADEHAWATAQKLENIS